MSAYVLRLGSLAACLVLGVAATAAGQSPAPGHSLAGLLAAFGAKVTSAATGLPVTPAAEEQVNDFAVLTALEVSAAPLGTSSGGFTFDFDKQTGTFKRSANTFGPAFAERALTLGKGKLTAGFNAMHARYSSFAGLNLANGDLQFVRAAFGPDGSPAPVFSAPISARLSADTAVAFVSFGVTNDLDISVTVPWVRITVGADATLLTATGVDITPGGHALLLPDTTASGVGDISVLAKYHFWHHDGGGLAAELQVHLPSGDPNNLRGTGVTRTLVSGIWSRAGRVSPHASFGYEYWSSGVNFTSTTARDQINYALGLEVQPHPRLTANIDIIGRRLLGAGQLTFQDNMLGPFLVDSLVDVPRGLNVVSAAPGIKWNVAGDVLMTGSIVTSIANKGLRANVIPVVGFEWAF